MPLPVSSSSRSTTDSREIVYSLRSAVLSFPFRLGLTAHSRTLPPAPTAAAANSARPARPRPSRLRLPTTTAARPVASSTSASAGVLHQHHSVVYIRRDHQYLTHGRSPLQVARGCLAQSHGEGLPCSVRLAFSCAHMITPW